MIMRFVNSETDDRGPVMATSSYVSVLQHKSVMYKRHRRLVSGLFHFLMRGISLDSFYF